jgi:hypothetical protein
MPHDYTALPPEGEKLLSRKDAAELLTRMGFKISPATLATKATRGGGPTFQSWGNKPLYQIDNLMVWAKSRLKKPRQSTSERDDNPSAITPSDVPQILKTNNAQDRL